MFVETSIDWALCQKKKQGLKIWNFQEYWRNGKWIFQGLTKNNVKFPGVLILGLKISKRWKIICGVSQPCFVWNFQGWSKKSKNSREGRGVQKSYVLFCFFFWNSPYTFYVWIDYFHNLCENFASIWAYSRN